MSSKNYRRYFNFFANIISFKSISDYFLPKCYYIFSLFFRHQKLTVSDAFKVTVIVFRCHRNFDCVPLRKKKFSCFDKKASECIEICNDILLHFHHTPICLSNTKQLSLSALLSQISGTL